MSAPKQETMLDVAQIEIGHATYQETETGLAFRLHLPGGATAVFVLPDLAAASLARGILTRLREREPPPTASRQ